MTSRQIAFSAATLLLATTLVACANNQEDFAEFDDDLEQGVALPVDAPQVTILDAGDTGDAQVWTFQDVDAEEPQDISVTAYSGFDQRIYQGEADPEAPAGGDVTGITVPLQAVTTVAGEPADDTLAPADREVSVRVGQAESTDLSQLEDLQTTDGFRLGWRANDNGAISAVTLTAPAEATDNGRALLETTLMNIIALPVVFPTEAMGTGASWTVDTRVTGAATLLQTTTYTITAINDGVLELDVDVAQRPSVSAIPVDDTGEELRVVSTDTTTEGELVVDLSKPIPVAGEVNFTTRVVYGGESSHQVAQDTTTAVHFGGE